MILGNKKISDKDIKRILKTKKKYAFLSGTDIYLNVTLTDKYSPKWFGKYYDIDTIKHIVLKNG